MSEHKANIKWARNGADFGYKNYSRDHIWKFDNGVEVPGSAAPAYLGNPQRIDPETAFVAALSSCHMLTFLAVASNKGFVVDSYEDNAVGRLEKNVDGKFAITRVELHPKISYSGDKQPTQTDIDWLHDKAHRECFIANSVTAEIRSRASEMIRPGHTEAPPWLPADAISYRAISDTNLRQLACSHQSEGGGWQSLSDAGDGLQSALLSTLPRQSKSRASRIFMSGSSPFSRGACSTARASVRAFNERAYS